MPMGWTDDAIAEELGAIALLAALPVMEAYARNCAALLKPDGSPVTEADTGAETVILDALSRRWPEVPVISEESTLDGTAQADADEFFLVDPLDGTREFLAHNGEFTINIALVRGGIPICGALYAPAFRRLWIGGTAAYEMPAEPGGHMPPRSLWHRVQVREAPATPVALVSRSHLTDETLRQMERLGVGEQRPMGSSLKFALIASGEADVTVRIGPTMQWDTAAGDALLRAAGGWVTTLSGEPLKYGNAYNNFRNPDFIARARGGAFT